jgi:hypothetical protein
MPGSGWAEQRSGSADLTLLRRVTPTDQLYGNHRDPHSDDGYPQARFTDAPDKQGGGDEQDRGHDPHHERHGDHLPIVHLTLWLPMLGQPSNVSE